MRPQINQHRMNLRLAIFAVLLIPLIGVLADQHLHSLGRFTHTDHLKVLVAWLVISAPLVGATCYALLRRP